MSSGKFLFVKYFFLPFYIFLLFFLFFFFPTFSFTQEITISGKIIDSEFEAPIEGVNIFLSLESELKSGINNNYNISSDTTKQHVFSVFSDTNGFFIFNSIPLYNKKFNCCLTASHVGYKNFNKVIVIDSSTFLTKTKIILTVDVILEPSIISTGEITVVSTRYNTLLKDTPFSMEILEKEEILKQPATNLPTLLDTKAGISLVKDGVWGAEISIRGLTRNNVVFLIDGNRVETSNDIAARLSLVDLYDIEKVEVIKGGSSVIYGTGALGGIINVVSKSGNFSNKTSLGGSLLCSYSSVNNEKLINLSFLVSSGLYYLKLAGTLRKAGNLNTPMGTVGNSQYKDDNLSLSAGLTPLKNQEIKFSFQRFSASDVGINGGFGIFPLNALVKYPYEKRELTSFEYISKNIYSGSAFSINKLSFKFFYQTVLRDVEVLQNQSQVVIGPPKQIINTTKLTPNSKNYTVGLQLQSDIIFLKRNYLIFGIDFWNRTLDSRREREQLIISFDSSGNNILSSTYKLTGERPIPESNFESLGLFLQNELSLPYFSYGNNTSKIILGLRTELNKISNSKVFNPVYVIINNGIINYNPEGQKVLWNEKNVINSSFSANLGVLFSVFNDIDLIFNTSYSFRSPSLEERYQYIDLGSAVRLGNPDLNIEKGIFFDFGIRTWKQNLNLNLNLFTGFFSDLVIEIPGIYENRTALIKNNSGKSRIYGFDMYFSYSPSSFIDLLFYTTISYTRGKDTENNLDLPQIPPLNSRVGLKTVIPVFENLFSIDFSTVLYARQDKIYKGETETPGYVIFNTYINTKPVFIYRKSKYIIFYLGVENIFNKSYKNHLSSNRGNMYIEPGRNFFIKSTINF